MRELWTQEVDWIKDFVYSFVITCISFACTQSNALFTLRVSPSSNDDSRSFDFLCGQYMKKRTNHCSNQDHSFDTWISTRGTVAYDIPAFQPSTGISDIRLPSSRPTACRKSSKLYTHRNESSSPVHHTPSPAGATSHSEQFSSLRFTSLYLTDEKTARGTLIRLWNLQAGCVRRTGE